MAKFQCNRCGTEFEVEQAAGEELPACPDPECQGAAKRIWEDTDAVFHQK